MSSIVLCPDVLICNFLHLKDVHEGLQSTHPSRFLLYWPRFGDVEAEKAELQSMIIPVVQTWQMTSGINIVSFA